MTAMPIGSARTFVVRPVPNAENGSDWDTPVLAATPARTPCTRAGTQPSLNEGPAPFRTKLET